MERIIAVDFDGTLCENRYPDIGEAIDGTVHDLLVARTAGAKLILWTCRTGEHLRNALHWCAALGLEFDAVNENLPETIAWFGSDTRKVYATEYWDDRAVVPEKKEGVL